MKKIKLSLSFVTAIIFISLTMSSCFKSKCEQSSITPVITYSGEAGDYVDIEILQKVSKVDFSDFTYTLYNPLGEKIENSSNDRTFRIDCLSGRLMGKWRCESNNKRCFKSESFLLKADPIECYSKINHVIVDNSERAISPYMLNDSIILANLGSNYILEINLKDVGFPSFDFSDYIETNPYLTNEDPCYQDRMHSISIRDTYWGGYIYRTSEYTGKFYSVTKNSDGSFSFEFCNIEFGRAGYPGTTITANVTIKP